MQPYFYSLSEFIAMGEHGIYVWTCWVMVFAVIIGLIVYSRQQRKRLLQDLTRQLLQKKQRQQAQNNYLQNEGNQNNTNSKKANHETNDKANSMKDEEKNS